MAGISTQARPKATSGDYQIKKGYAGPLIVVTMLFFMWGLLQP